MINEGALELTLWDTSPSLDSSFLKDKVELNKAHLDGSYQGPVPMINPNFNPRLIPDAKRLVPEIKSKIKTNLEVASCTPVFKGHCALVTAKVDGKQIVYFEPNYDENRYSAPQAEVFLEAFGMGFASPAGARDDPEILRDGFKHLRGSHPPVYESYFDLPVSFTHRTFQIENGDIYRVLANNPLTEKKQLMYLNFALQGDFDKRFLEDKGIFARYFLMGERE